MAQAARTPQSRNDIQQNGEAPIDPRRAELMAEIERLKQVEMVGLRRQKIAEARDSLVTFTQITMPKPGNDNDPMQSRYIVKNFHQGLANELEAIERGDTKRLIICFPPRHGKTELASNRFISWCIGRDPYRNIIFGTYNQPFADVRGRKIKKIIQDPTYADIFPDLKLAKGEQASDHLMTEEGGELVFVGRGGSSTGRGADIIIIDDPHKDRKEANSETIRNDVWGWYNDTIETRLMSDEGAIIIIMTRWHEDDLVGRLTDENNPYYRREEAEQWKIINIRALAEDDDVLGRPIGEPLWPEKFGKEKLERKMRKNPIGFSALYQQRPNPADGDNFKAEMFDVGYDSLSDLPPNLRWYAASDHVTGSKQGHDCNVIMIVGVDYKNRIWIHPDLYWVRSKTDVMVDQMLAFMQRYKPILWWAGKDHISGSIEPFLRKRMHETGTYIHIVEQSEKGDKLAKAQPAIGRCAMGMVKWPKFAPWYGKARTHFLKFPNGNFDDIVDALSHICRGLERQVGGAVPEEAKKDETRVIGSMAWIKNQTKIEEDRKRIERALRAA
jgi:hypothetical protein